MVLGQKKGALTAICLAAERNRAGTNERNLHFVGGGIGGIRNGERGAGGEKGGGRLISARRTMERAGREPPERPF